MKKKVESRTCRYMFLWTLIITLLLSNLIVNADTDIKVTSVPSAWALEEIRQAKASGLLPDELSSDYVSSIKRNEYAALALLLYKRAGKEAVITNKEPFKDITGDRYEKELIEAYNAGLITGYGNGMYNPSANMTREEIASLIVKLVKAVNPNEAITVKTKQSFQDANLIGSWAKTYVEYCYENGIMKGISGNKIDPKGASTREQAIALIYRLGISKRIISEPEKASGMTSAGAAASVMGSVTFESIKGIFSNSLYEYIEDFLENKAYDSATIEQSSVVITIDEEKSINFAKGENGLTATFTFTELSDTLYIQEISKAATDIAGNDGIAKLIKENIGKANQTLSFQSIDGTILSTGETLKNYYTGENIYIVRLYAQ